MVYFAACRASTAWSKLSNAGFPLSTKDSGQNKAGMSWVMGLWALSVTYVQQRLTRPWLTTVLWTWGVGVGVRCHGDGSAPVQELVQERPQVQGALPEWKVGNSEGIHAGS